MDTIFWILAALGAAVAIYWLVTVLIGVFGDKTKIGRAYLVKRFREHGIDPLRFSEHQLDRIAFNAFSVASFGGSPNERFSNDKFTQELEYRVELISRYLKGAPLDPDDRDLAETLLDSAPFLSDNSRFHSPSSS